VNRTHSLSIPLTRCFNLVALIVGVTLALSGCALHQSDPDAGPSRTSISEAEIDSLHAPNAYEVIRRLRPQFLHSRGPVTLGTREPPPLPNVYIDNMFYGDASVLPNIAASTIATIRFYNASEAQYAFGRGNAAGVIAITTKH
jgi:hypothetical protein